MTKAQAEAQLRKQLKEQFGDTTDLNNTLSYDSKVQNVFGMRDTKGNIRIKVDNDTEDDQLIIFGCPSAVKIFNQYGLPEGIPFTGIPIKLPEEGAEELPVTITTMNREQKLEYIANEAEINPIFFRGASFKSYQIVGGSRVADDSNFGNEIIHYTLNSIKAKLEKSTPLHLGASESRKDVNTSVMSVDFLKEKFFACMSKNDLFVMTINAKTQLEITLKVGARWSESELFQRQIFGAFELESAGLIGAGASCGCNK